MKAIKWSMSSIVLFAAGSVALAQNVTLRVDPADVRPRYSPGTVVTINMVADRGVSTLQVDEITSNHGGTAQSPLTLHPSFNVLPLPGTLVNAGSPYILIQYITGSASFPGYVPAGNVLHSFEFRVPDLPDGTVITLDDHGITYVLFDDWITDSQDIGSVNLVVDNPVGCIVPNVVGQTEGAAGTTLAGRGLVAGSVSRECSNTVPAGQVIAQSRTPGTSVACGSAVDLVVSTGGCPVRVPNVVGQTQGAAGTTLAGVGLVVGSISSECSNTVPAGRVIRQSPVAGTLVDAGSSVNVVISTGDCPPTNVPVPDLVGWTEGVARTMLANGQLTAGIVDEECSDVIPEGQVIRQNPPAGTLRPVGSAVDFTVSSGRCPSPKEACCFADGGCQNWDPDMCRPSGGTPMGPGTQCDTDGDGRDDICPQTQACCFSDGRCQDLPESECRNKGGVPKGVATQCLGDGNGDRIDDICGLPTGACCNPWGGCFELEEATCLVNGWTWAGPDTQCKGDLNQDGFDDTCVAGACCDPKSGTCSVVSEQACIAEDGVWQGSNTQCVGDADFDGLDDTCPSLPGACCNRWGSCFELRQAECVSNGWTWKGPATQCLGDLDGDGFDDTCSGSGFGACCEPSSGKCFERMRDFECRDLGGIWHGAGTVCMGDADRDGIDDSCPAVGSCCDALGSCYVLTQEMCKDLPNSKWGGPGTQCLGDTDTNGIDDTCEGKGACCDPSSGSCMNMLENECVKRGWIWHWAGSQCLGDKNRNGVDDACIPVGACCGPLGQCWIRTEAVCKMQGLRWVWQGPGTQCLGDSDDDGKDDVCGPARACCLDGGSCEDLLVSDCLDLGGTPQEAGVRCSDNPCASTGACCDPATGACQNLTEHDCLGRGRDWHGPNTRCLGDGNRDGRDDVCGGIPQKKWTQPPIGITGASNTPPFNGWDQRSWYAFTELVADDWLCKDSRPVTGIRWWGSFVGWTNPELPSVKPRAFHVGIWTDAAVTTGFSHPGQLVWEYRCNEWELEFAGYNKNPQAAAGTGDDACFVYTVKLPRDAFFYQQGQGPSGTRYWLSISAEYNPDGPEPAYIWGWTTRPDVQNGGAVKIAFPIKPVIDDVWKAGSQICQPPCLKTGGGKPWDVSFELIAN